MLPPMGAPKQKWTAEEESALKAGVIKHGAGKWRTILKDPEFSGVLYTRSNVDLKVGFLLTLYTCCTAHFVGHEVYPCFYQFFNRFLKLFAGLCSYGVFNFILYRRG